MSCKVDILFQWSKKGKGEFVMTLQEKIDLIEEFMDVDEGSLTIDTVLADLEEWDSLSTLTLTSEMKQRYGMNITTDIIKKLKTVQDICELFPE